MLSWSKQVLLDQIWFVSLNHSINANTHFRNNLDDYNNLASTSSLPALSSSYNDNYAYLDESSVKNQNLRGNNFPSNKALSSSDVIPSPLAVTSHQNKIANQKDFKNFDANEVNRDKIVDEVGTKTDINSKLAEEKR